MSTTKGPYRMSYGILGDLYDTARLIVAAKKAKKSTRTKKKKKSKKKARKRPDAKQDMRQMAWIKTYYDDNDFYQKLKKKMKKKKKSKSKKKNKGRR